MQPTSLAVTPTAPGADAPDAPAAPAFTLAADTRSVRLRSKENMSSWTETYENVIAAASNLSAGEMRDVFFRGQADSTWTLRPELARMKRHEFLENRLYYQFIALGAHLIPATASSWDHLFIMRHHRIPTRLLDWTESFAAALYFALVEPADEAAIWVLDPYKLNELTTERKNLLHLEAAYPDAYTKFFTDSRTTEFGRFPWDVVAVAGSSTSERMRSQRGMFTLHKELEAPLEQLFPAAVQKIEIPSAEYEDARRFVQLAGVNEYALFPDLDGLGRYLRGKELNWDAD
jgi:hypothetical protein